MPPSAAASVPSSAAAPSSAVTDTKSVSLDSVVITATRRREPAREVPMKVDVIAPDALQEAGAKGLTEYLNTQPGVDIKSLGSPGLGIVTIRGVSTGNSASPTVGIYVDDVAVSTSSPIAGASTTLDMTLLDLNHIEVLRGPQGTLYGAGAMGGLLKYVTNVPDTSLLSGRVGLGASLTGKGGASGTVNGVLNVPLKEDVAAIRFSGYVDRAGGMVDTVGPYARTDADRGLTSAGRLSFLLTPTRHLTVRLTALAQRIRRDQSSYVDYDPATHQPVSGDLQRQSSIAEPYFDNRELVSADIEYDFGWARLNSITSAQRAHTSQTSDSSALYVPLLSSLGLNVATAYAVVDPRLRKTTQEFRLTSKTGSAFEWLAGVYYDRETVPFGFVFNTGLSNGQAGPQLLSGDEPSHYREIAGYADGTWKITPKFSVTGGIRVARNSQTFSNTGSGLLNGGNTFNAGESSDTSTTYLATAQYALTATSNAYVRVASGYRAGGPNPRIVDVTTGQPAGPAAVAPDTLWSYESGYKAELLDKALSLDVALYDVEWKDIQQVSSINGLSFLVNGSKARIRGLEASAGWRASPALTLNGSLSYIDAHLTEGDASIGLAAGDRLPNSARLSGALNATYRFALAGKESFVGVSERLVGNRTSGFPGSTSIPNYTLPGYGMTDLQAGMKIDNVDLSFYVRNVFDHRAQLSALANGLALGGPALVAVSQPRTVGFWAAVNF